MGYKRNTFGNKKIYVASAVSLLSICAIAGGVMIKGNDPKKQDNTAYVVDLNESNITDNSNVANNRNNSDVVNNGTNNGTNSGINNGINNQGDSNKTARKDYLEEETTLKNKTDAEASGDVEKPSDNKINKNEYKNSEDDKEADKKENKNDNKKADGNETATKEAGAIGTDITGLNFSKESTLVWPVEGQIIIDFDMENVVYFPTLDIYKCSDAVCIQSKEGTPVYAGANATVLEIGKDSQIGNYVKMNLGNGFEVIYGSLKDIQVSGGLTIKEGDLVGYVSSPTKYYSLEGEHLYIKMTENGNSVDPVDFLNYQD